MAVSRYPSIISKYDRSTSGKHAQLLKQALFYLLISHKEFTVHPSCSTHVPLPTRQGQRGRVWLKAPVAVRQRTKQRELRITG